jgi:uncharacterized protein (TIGR03437 family)
MKYRWPNFVFCLALVCVAFSLYPTRRKYAQTRPRDFRARGSAAGKAQVVSQGFITRQTETGATCLALTEPELARVQAGVARVELHDSSEQTAQAQPTQLKFNLRTTPQLESSAAAKAALLRAAARWQAAITTPIEVVVNVDFGPTAFGSSFPAPDTTVVTTVGLRRIAMAVSVGSVLSFVPADTQHQAVWDLIPGPDVPTDLVLTSFIGWAQPETDAVGVFSGGLGLVNSSIGFNSNSKYDFDPSDGIDADRLDFESIAAHELGHALGFISNVGAREVSPALQPSLLGLMHAVPTVWDLYRFRPGVTMETFQDAPRLQLSGGEHVFFTGDVELPLSTGRPDGVGGDGRHPAHWQDDALSGRYLGLLDPTSALGERGLITANDLHALSYFGYEINCDAQVAEVLSVDDGGREEARAFNGALVVNRMTPAKAPCIVQAVRVQLPPADGASPVGQQLRVVVFADPARTGQPPANPQLLAERTVTIPALPESRVLEVALPGGPTISNGDLYIGLQASNSSVLFAGDRNGAQRRSFISTNNGASFQPLQTAAGQPLSLMARAVVSAKYNAANNLPIELTLLSPSATKPSGFVFTLFVTGRNFQPNSVVRWNGQNRETVFLSGTRLRAFINPADIVNTGTARVTVFTPGADGGKESAPLEFRIAAEAPAPVLTQLQPNAVPTGSAAFDLTVLGRDFTPSSVLRWNGSDRLTEVVSSVELRAKVLANDLISAANAEVTVFTPAPGGGSSNALSLLITPCQYALGASTQLIGQGLGSNVRGEPGGVLLTTGALCRWTASSDVPWISINEPQSGMGRFPITYNVAANTSPLPRTGTITVGGQSLTVRQVGIVTTVSAASFKEPFPQEGIASLFGVGLARSTQAAAGTPLPTNLAGTEVRLNLGSVGIVRAPLFFVSPEQINFLMPDRGISTAVVGIAVFNNDTLVAESTGRAEAVAPGLFTVDATGRGLAAAVVLRIKADGTRTFEPVARFDPAQGKFVAVPIDLGAETDQVFLLLFGTGVRKRSALSASTVKVGGVDAPVQFAGAQGEFAGLDQLNVLLPRSLKGRGEVTVNCVVEQRDANPVTVTIK